MSMSGRKGQDRPICGLGCILTSVIVVIVFFYAYALYEMSKDNLNPLSLGSWAALWPSKESNLRSTSSLSRQEEEDQDQQKYMHVDLEAYMSSAASASLRKSMTMKWENGEVSWPARKRFKDKEKDEYPDFSSSSLLQILEAWNPDNPDPPPNFKESLQHFNYSCPFERALAAEYRDANVPFKLYNVPEFNRVSAKWTDKYLLNELGQAKNVHVESSEDNHFMYWAMKPWKKRDAEVKKYVPPTKIITNDMPFVDWLQHAKQADAQRYSIKQNQDTPHYYFMSNAQKRDRGQTFIARDLPMFSGGDVNFFIPKPEANKGIQCRFGMRGVIAEAHYDTGRNMIVMLKGAKRYILAPPSACKQVKLIPDKDHPSFRHSVLDWSNITVARENNFHLTHAIDTIVRAKEVLFVPSFWLHYIVSLQYSVQCNSRFGPPDDEALFAPIEECFDAALKAKTKFY